MLHPVKALVLSFSTNVLAPLFRTSKTFELSSSQSTNKLWIGMFLHLFRSVSNALVPILPLRPRSRARPRSEGGRAAVRLQRGRRAARVPLRTLSNFFAGEASVQTPQGPRRSRWSEHGPHRDSMLCCASPRAPLPVAIAALACLVMGAGFFALARADPR